MGTGMRTKTYSVTFSLSIVLPIALAIALPIALALVARSPGIHSTPGMWLMIAGLPGTMIGAWTGDGLLFYFTSALANWTFYSCIAAGVISLKASLTRRA